MLVELFHEYQVLTRKMSNSVGQILIQQHFLRPTVLKHQSKLNNSSGVPNISFCANASLSNSFAQQRRSWISTKFYGNRLIRKGKQKIAMGSRRAFTFIPQAQHLARFNVDGNIELQVDASTPTSGSFTQVNFKIIYSSDSLLLHWGVICDGNENWVLPSRQPEGTKDYKNKALRTPFVESGSSSFLKLEFDDPSIQAIEIKNNGQNFHVKLPRKETLISNISLPEDLVQIQAYLRWERKEYEAARAELLEEIARGTSMDDIRTKLTKKGGQEFKDSAIPEKTNTIPDDLVQIQSYIRWEKAGKPNYSPGQQLREFDEARKELQFELEKGASLDVIRKKITKGEIETKVSKPPQNKRYFSAQRTQRKQRDLMVLLNKHSVKSVEGSITVEPKPLTAVESFARKIELDSSPVMNKKIYKFGERDVLVLVTKSADKIKIHIASDFEEPLTLHWALSEKAGEWLPPPRTVLPPGSVSLGGAAESTFSTCSFDDLPKQVQCIELEIEDGNFKGMPFVLLSGEKWIKHNGSDFYVDFSQRFKQGQKDAGDGKGTSKVLLDRIAEMESEAQKSFMHRFNIASDLMDQAKDTGELGLAGILVWMRFMATRQLIWNKNYNVKPREISKAQDRLTDLLQSTYTTHPQQRELLRMIMSTVGRGGEGDVGQRIRDEILVIQRNNDCKGGMMEEWHQKLHNNTSPDDVVICQALIDYIKSDFDISIYWKTLTENGITKERLLSYDRAIHSDPSFRRDQKDGLLRDLGHYMRTLKAVHSGADLESAISNCMGYQAEGEGFMVGVQINPVAGLPSGFPELLRFILQHVEDRNVEALIEGLLEARQELRPLLSKSSDRLKDLLFLDIALDSTVRTATERAYEELNNAGPEKIMYFITLVLENLALSSDDNEDLIYCLKGWHHAISLCNSQSAHWALYAKSVLDRTRLGLSSKAEWYQRILQPSAEYLGSLLEVDPWAINIFTEEVIRAGSAATLSSLINRLDPVLRETAHLGSWQVISPVEVVGYVDVVEELLAVQNKSYDRPTILVAKSVKGEEEIPDGTVAVLTPDMPDVLSHVSVRARNCKVCFATCFDPKILADLQANKGKLLRLKPSSADVVYSEVKEGDLADSSNLKGDGPSSITLVRKQFGGKYAISAEEFTPEMVGAKSRNISYLKGKVPSWVGIPTSVALPFGVFEKVLADKLNQRVVEKLQILKKKLGEGDFDALGEIRQTVLQLAAPPKLVKELKAKLLSSGMPWPGDEGEQRWEQAWTAITKVWASKWNERAYFSTRKAKLDHEYLCMAVLVQEIINADYAFVIHTTNPSSGDSSEIYAEVVKGLGETLVGAYPGRALSFVCKKNNLSSPQVLGYPSKPIALFIRRSIIFRSDSNGEDLEGYAGAGLYDSVPMDEEEKVVVDYSCDPLLNDGKFQQSILSSIAGAGKAIEELYRSPQDIEGVIRDGKVYVVQTRPQM
ncbi:alpha-glucan water dikinase, chloroplastic-like isoform X2 [Gossypium australe]|uniref:Alpha-glucan water dikinase, chloroplastic-like isoform X2 n=1 Tax=Gossypium australe TaxID=47621 RepID=A0A5B6V0I6_9ROSI|nr:alpha-glucan water dikinase, chloroplastic-like isoform X2 [Gossypium australe]